MRADPAVLKGISQLLLVIGGLFGIAVCACTGLAVLLHAPPPLPTWLAQGADLPVLAALCGACALGGALWIRADRLRERKNRRPPLSSQGIRDPTHFSAFELKPGMRYRVMVPFVDFDGQEHQAGESWVYQSRNFLPYEAGLTLYVSGSGSMTNIRLQDYPEAQGAIIGRFHEHVREELAAETTEKQAP
jgi:hypothetical protein